MFNGIHRVGRMKMIMRISNDYKKQEHSNVYLKNCVFRLHKFCVFMSVCICVVIHMDNLFKYPQHRTSWYKTKLQQPHLEYAVLSKLIYIQNIRCVYENTWKYVHTGIKLCKHTFAVYVSERRSPAISLRSWAFEPPARNFTSSASRSWQLSGARDNLPCLLELRAKKNVGPFAGCLRLHAITKICGVPRQISLIVISILLVMIMMKRQITNYSNESLYK